MRRAVDLGSLAVVRENGMVRLRSEVTVPTVAAGRYTMLVCTPGCEGPTRDRISTPVSVYATTSDAVLADRLRRLEQRLQNYRYRLRKPLLRDVRELERDVVLTSGQTGGQIRGLDDRLTDAENRLERQGLLAATPAPSRTPVALWLLGGLAVLLAGAALAVALRIRPAQTDPIHAEDRGERQPTPV